MKIITITSQAEFDKVQTIKADEEVVFDSSKIRINCILQVFGILRLKGEIDSSWNGRFIVAWESSQVHNVAWGSSQVHNEARGSSQIHQLSFNFSVSTNLTSIASLKLLGYAVALLPIKAKVKIQKSKTSIVHRFNPDVDWFDRNGVNKGTSLILFKKVSADFKTKENTPNETLWIIGSMVTHKDWHPQEKECGGGKFHACSRPYFCDEFRDVLGDKYIAVKVKLVDLYEWKTNPLYPHKIGFREGKVLYECDRFGKRIN